MAARKSRTTDLERELAALAPIEADPDAGRDALRAALLSSHGPVVARAATIVRRAELGGLDRELVAAFDRLATLGVKADPGCHAKVALLEALDATGWRDEEPFLGATRVVQREPSWGPPVDTATGVRARGVLALARQGFRDLPLLAAELLDDPEVPVRIAAADALGAHGSRDAGGALIARLARGDDDPTVEIACIAALLALAPDWALGVLRRGTLATRRLDRELAAIALGESRREDALELLTLWLGEALARDRAALLRAIGLHRSERAIAVLLERIAQGSEAEALAAIEALAPRRFDPGVSGRARDAASGRGEALMRAVTKTLESE